MANIYEVAKRVGVSTATVSRVLSQPNVVAPATRRRVLEAIERLGYEPNSTAQSLRTTLEAGGFKSVTPVKLGESDAPDLQNIEMHWHVGGKEIDEATSQFVEATRP